MNIESKEFDLRLGQLNSYAEHLRTIHFTLVITVFVVLVGTMTAIQPDHAKALNELQIILNALGLKSLQESNQTKEHTWDPNWLIRKLYQRNNHNLNPGLSIDKKDFEAFITKLNSEELVPRNLYFFLGHAFRINESHTGLEVNRLYPADQNGPLFYASDAAKEILMENTILLFLYPCIDFDDVKSTSFTCDMQQSNYDLAFPSLKVVEAYETLRTRPPNIGAFRKFWKRLQSLRLQKVSISAELKYANAVILRPIKNSVPNKTIASVIHCALIKVNHGVSVSYPVGAEPIGFGLSMHFNSGNTEINHKLSALAKPCELGQGASVRNGVIHWQTGHMVYIDPFHTYHAEYANDKETSWFVFQLPVSQVSWDPIDGLGYLDPNLGPMSGLDFDSAFPNLSKTSSRLNELSWNDLETVLKDQSIKQSETVGVLGVSIPLTSIYFLGSLAIIAIQLYMYAYATIYVSLARTYPQAFNMQNFPWIGITKGNVYECMSLGTAGALPFTSILVSSFISVKTTTDLYSVAAASIIIFLECVILIPQCQRLHALHHLSV
jgi:hypothetical protein